MKQAQLFAERRGLFHDNIATTGGVRLEKYAAVGLDLALLNPLDARNTITLRDNLSRPGGILVGFNIDPRWFTGIIPSNGWRDELGNVVPDPLLFRRKVSELTGKLLRAGDPVVLDFEKLTHAWQRAFFCGTEASSIDGWRGTNGGIWNGGTNQGRPTAVTNYFHQDNPLKLYLDCDVALLDQLYDEKMNDVSAWKEKDWVASDAEAEGVELANQFDPNDLVVCPIYDSADYDPEELTPGSYLFNQDRLEVLFT